MSVSNLSKSRDWYKQLFEIEPIEDIENFVSFKIQNVCFDLCLADEKSPTSTGGSVGYWSVDNLESLLEKVHQLGGSIYRGPLNIKEIQRTIVQIQDPFGSILGFETLLQN
jgi:predicted enzyme related to lactoylglutathione lyase